MMTRSKYSCVHSCTRTYPLGCTLTAAKGVFETGAHTAVVDPRLRYRRRACSTQLYGAHVVRSPSPTSAGSALASMALVGRPARVSACPILRNAGSDGISVRQVKAGTVTNGDTIVIIMSADTLSTRSCAAMAAGRAETRT